MEWETLAHTVPVVRPRRKAWRRVGAGLAGAALLLSAMPAVAASLSAQELETIGRTLAFMQPPPAGGSVAVVYSAADPASRQDARAIVAEIGPGLDMRGTRLPARMVEAGMLAGGGYAVAVAAAGANGPVLGAAVRAAHILCVTAELPAVQAGFCTMAISTDLRVQIVLNHAAAAASGINFVAAFRMMIHEI